MPVHIRPVQFSGDIQAILALEKVTFAEDAFPMTEFLRLYMRGRDTFLVAIDESNLVGYISAYQFQSFAYIASIAVGKSQRRQGTGKKLMQAVIQIFQNSQQVTRLNLHVRQQNTPAIKLYQSLGFEINGSDPGYYGIEDAFVMSLDFKD